MENDVDNSKIRLWGSTAALILGLLSLVAGISQVGQGLDSTSAEAGLAMTGGAIAYRAIKKRKAGRNTIFTNPMVDIVGLILVTIIIFAGIKSDLWFTDPFPFLIIPLWAYIAYGFVYFRQSSSSRNIHTESKADNINDNDIQTLLQFKKLKDEGILTDDEFEEQKKRILKT